MNRFPYIWLTSLFLISWASDNGLSMCIVVALVLLWFVAGLIGFSVYSRDQEAKRQHDLNERMKGVADEVQQAPEERR